MAERGDMVNTSGSIGQDELQQFFAGIERMCSGSRVHLVEDEVCKEMRDKTLLQEDIVAVAVRAAILWLRKANRWAWVERLTKQLVPRLRHGRDRCASQLVGKMKSGELKTDQEQKRFLREALYNMAIEAGIETAKAAAEPPNCQCPIIAP